MRGIENTIDGGPRWQLSARYLPATNLVEGKRQVYITISPSLSFVRRGTAMGAILQCKL
jgi:hypothetical protein